MYIYILIVVFQKDLLYRYVVMLRQNLQQLLIKEMALIEDDVKRIIGQLRDDTCLPFPAKSCVRVQGDARHLR